MVRVTDERLPKENFRDFRQIGEREFFFRSLELDEVPVQLDAVLFVFLDREAQKYRRMAGIALINESYVLRLIFQQIRKVRNGLRRHVGIDTAIRALQTELLVGLLLKSLVPLYYDCHCSLSYAAGGFL